MRIGVLGTTVLEGSRPLTRRDRTVLAVLVLGAPDPVSPGWLGDALWGEGLPATWTKVLQGAVSRLRRTLGSDAIELVPGGYRLTVPTEDVDARRFEHLVENAARVARTDPVTAADDLEAAFGLWRGRPFADLADWPESIGAVCRLEARRRSADELWIEILLACARADDAVASARELVAGDPLDERLAALLASSLYAAGRPVEALATLHDVAGRLRSELGLEAGPELKALELAMLEHDPALLAPAALVHRRARQASDVPQWRSSFIGRADELASVREGLAHSQVVTVTGPGGAGKTRLAYEVARAVAMDGRVEVSVVALADLDARSDSVAEAVARVLGARTIGTEPTAALEAQLSSREIVLVLDNCEHVPDATRELVARLTEASAGLTILATSRRPLGLDGERIVRVGGLATDEAAELFRVRSVAGGSVPKGGQEDAVLELCARLDGLPLAIELAAARSTALGPSEILDRLGNDPTLLASDRLDHAARHRTLTAVFEWSYELLDDGERFVLECHSMFPGGASLAALEAVCGDALDGRTASAVAGLVSASMLSRFEAADGTSRYHTHEAVRALARERLVQRGALDEVEDRVLTWMESWSRRVSHGFGLPDEARWRTVAESERTNVAEAIRLALTRHEAARAVTLCTALRNHVLYSLDLGATSWFAHTAAALGSDREPDDGEVVSTLALLQWLGGDAEDAIRTVGAIDRNAHASLLAQAFAQHVRGLVTGKIDHLRAAARLADASAYTTASVAFRAPLTLALATRAPDEALKCAREAWDLATGSGNPSALASAHLSAAAVCLHRDPATSRAHLMACRVLANDATNRQLAIMADLYESMISHDATPDERAIEHAVAALDAAARLRDRGARVQAGMALLRAADLLAAAGDARTASKLVTAAELNGVEDWRRYRTAFDLTHLDTDPQQFPFFETPSGLDAAIECGLLAVDRLRA